MNGNGLIRSLLDLGENVGPVADPRSETFASATAGFPVEHVKVLAAANGLTVYHGGFRLFGVRDEPYLDLATWNEWETWRFAWGDRITPFVSFGETAWGDQYAYRRQGETGRLSPEVYFLEGVALRAEVIAPDFPAFVESEFLRNATNPYDSQTVKATNRLGPIATDQHRVYAPSLALGGSESIENVDSMPAMTAMVVAGDIATSLSTAPANALVSGVEPWCDDRGRDRMRVLYSHHS